MLWSNRVLCHSLRDGINWYFSNSAKCGSSNMSGLAGTHSYFLHHETPTPTGCTYLYFRNYMPRNESGTEMYFSTFIFTFDILWRTTKIRLTDRMLRLFSNSNSNFTDSSDWKVKLCVLLRYVTLMKIVSLLLFLLPCCAASHYGPCAHTRAFSLEAASQLQWTV